MFARSVWLILRKDLTVEVRSGEIAYTTLFFAVSCILIFAFALVRDGRGPEDGAAGLLWIATAFAGTLALGRTFERERQSETLRALLMAPAARPAVYVGKLLGIVALLAGVSVDYYTRLERGNAAGVSDTVLEALVHFDRNGLGYTLDRDTGELLVAEKYDPKVNWTSGVDMNKSSPTYGRPKVLPQYSTEKQDVNVKGICPAALGTKDEQPAAFSPDTGLFYVPTNHVCMDYEPFRVSYTAGQPYVGATLSMYPPQGETHMGNFIAWDARTGKIVWSVKEQFSVWSGALATAGGVVFYGTLEGYLKAVDAKTGKELYKFKTPSGIIGNVTTYENNGKQYIAILSGVGGWAGIGLAAGLTDPTAGLGAVGGYAALSNYTSLGGQLTVFALPGN